MPETNVYTSCIQTPRLHRKPDSRARCASVNRCHLGKEIAGRVSIASSWQIPLYTFLRGGLEVLNAR